MKTLKKKRETLQVSYMTQENGAIKSGFRVAFHLCFKASPSELVLFTRKFWLTYM